MTRRVDEWITGASRVDPPGHGPIGIKLRDRVGAERWTTSWAIPEWAGSSCVQADLLAHSGIGGAISSIPGKGQHYLLYPRSSGPFPECPGFERKILSLMPMGPCGGRALETSWAIPEWAGSSCVQADLLAHSGIGGAISLIPGKGQHYFLYPRSPGPFPECPGFERKILSLMPMGSCGGRALETSWAIPEWAGSSCVQADLLAHSRIGGAISLIPGMGQHYFLYPRSPGPFPECPGFERKLLSLMPMGP